MRVTGERLDNGTLELYSLDVGQAAAAVVITEEGEILLTDVNEDAIIEGLETVLADRTIERTDNGTILVEFAATHLHRAHVNGLHALSRNEYEVSHAIQPPESRIEIQNAETQEPKRGIAENAMRDYYTDLEALGVEEITRVSTGDTIPIASNADLTVLAPPDATGTVDVTRAATDAEVGLPPVRPNENGAVYKFDGERSALFMGDIRDTSDHYAESWLIQQHDDPESDIDLDADVLFVGHHGSAHATSEEFLDRVEPETAVISSEVGGLYDHPHDEVLKNLHDADIEVYWTAGHGTVRTDLDGALTTAQTTDLDTTDAADLAALKHYCQENDATPEAVEALAPGNLPEETPDWVADAAPMVAETPEEIVDAAIANADYVDEVRQTLDDHPDAAGHLREAIETDQDDHVTTYEDAKAEWDRKKAAQAEANRAAQETQNSSQSWREKIRARFPKRPGGSDPAATEPDTSPEHEPDEPSEQIGEPPRPADYPNPNVGMTAADYRKLGIQPDDDRLAAEQAADTAVETAENSGELCWGLRQTPSAHKDCLSAIDEPRIREKGEATLPDWTTKNQTEMAHITSNDQELDEDFGLGL